MASSLGWIMNLNSLLSSTGVDTLSPEGWSLPLMGLVAGRYRYLSDLLYLDICVPVTRPYAWPRGLSPLVVEAFVLLLKAHPD